MFISIFCSCWLVVVCLCLISDLSPQTAVATLLNSMGWLNHAVLLYYLCAMTTNGSGTRTLLLFRWHPRSHSFPSSFNPPPSVVLLVVDVCDFSVEQPLTFGRHGSRYLVILLFFSFLLLCTFQQTTCFLASFPCFLFTSCGSCPSSCALQLHCGSTQAFTQYIKLN